MPTHATHSPFVRFLRDYLLLNANPVIRFLIISDVVWRAGVGLLVPIFPLFVVEHIEGGNAFVVGVAMTIGLVTKGVFQIPAATIIDKIKGEIDDFWIMTVCTALTLFMPLLFLVAHSPLEVYLIEFFANLFLAFTFPAFMAIFTRHVDHDHAGTAWGLYFTLTDFAGALAAGVGGAIALRFGFETLIVLSVCISMTSVLLILPMRPHMRRAEGLHAAAVPVPEK